MSAASIIAAAQPVAPLYEDLFANPPRVEGMSGRPQPVLEIIPDYGTIPNQPRRRGIQKGTPAAYAAGRRLREARARKAAARQALRAQYEPIGDGEAPKKQAKRIPAELKLPKREYVVKQSSSGKTYKKKVATRPLTEWQQEVRRNYEAIKKARNGGDVDFKDVIKQATLFYRGRYPPERAAALAKAAQYRRAHPSLRKRLKTQYGLTKQPTTRTMYLMKAYGLDPAKVAAMAQPKTNKQGQPIKTLTLQTVKRAIGLNK